MFTQVNFDFSGASSGEYDEFYEQMASVAPKTFKRDSTSSSFSFNRDDVIDASSAARIIGRCIPQSVKKCEFTITVDGVSKCFSKG